MRDSIIKNTGNSRYLKSAISAATTWEQFRAALIAGTLPIDLNGINTAGWQQVGDALSKANLLSDATVSALNAFLTSALPANPQVTDALKSLATVGLGKIAYGSYIGTGTYGASNPCSLTFPFAPKILIITAYGTPSSTSTTQKTYFLAVIGQSGGSAISGAAGNAGTARGISASVSNTSMDWYGDSDTQQGNINTKQYHYIAIG